MDLPYVQLHGVRTGELCGSQTNRSPISRGAGRVADAGIRGRVHDLSRSIRSRGGAPQWAGKLSVHGPERPIFATCAVLARLTVPLRVMRVTLLFAAGWRKTMKTAP